MCSFWHSGSFELSKVKGGQAQEVARPPKHAANSAQGRCRPALQRPITRHRRRAKQWLDEDCGAEIIQNEETIETTRV